MSDEKTPLWPADYGLPPDHCGDVVRGSYDLPFSPKEPPTIIDIGANVGAFVRWASVRWHGCIIHAYEPEPGNFALLQKTANAFANINATLHNVAVADVDSDATLHEGQFNCGEWSLFSNNGKGTRKVHVITADSLPKADILKIDAEGAEFLILTQLEKSGRLREFSAVMFEIHSGEWVEPLRKLLIDAGFVCTGENVHAEHRHEMKFIRKELDVPYEGPIIVRTSTVKVGPAMWDVASPAIIEKKTRVLFATPLSAAGADSNYLRTLVSAILMQEPGIHIDFMSSDCGCVGFARNEIGHHAEQEGFDKIVWCDDDQLLMPKHIVRMLSHDVDLVAGAYCKRRPGKPHWLFVPLKGAVQQSNGLLECTKVATGVQCLKVSCLTALRSMFPEEEFLAQESPDAPVQTRMNYYKMGVSGPRTADARLKRVKAALNYENLPPNWSDAPDAKEMMYRTIMSIAEACFDKQPPGTLHGEDFWNSVMLREAGFRIFVDLGMPVIPHIGKAAFPLTTDMVGFGPGIPVTLPTAEEN